MAAAEKIEGQRPKNEIAPSKQAIAKQNQNSYAMLGQMTGGVQKMPGRKRV